MCDRCEEVAPQLLKQAVVAYLRSRPEGSGQTEVFMVNLLATFDAGGDNPHDPVAEMALYRFTEAFRAAVLAAQEVYDQQVARIIASTTADAEAWANRHAPEG